MSLRCDAKREASRPPSRLMDSVTALERAYESMANATADRVLGLIGFQP